MSEIASWYYVGSFGQLGPLTKDQMEELIEGSVVEKGTYVWKPGMTDWLAAGSVADFAVSFARQEPFQSPPPIPSNVPPAVGGVGMSQPPQHNYQAPGQPSMPPEQYGGAPQQPQYGQYPMAPAGYTRRQMAIYKSDKSRTLSGILQIIFPGIGRIYLGYAALGVIQLVLSVITCGVLHIWSIIDGILLLSGQVRLDGYGRALED
jgi:TM2 domain-containing membrane protein YozV